MKKILIITAILGLSMGLLTKAKAGDRDCTKDYLYDRQQSLVQYHYKDESGKTTDKTFGKWAGVPDALKKMCWECWVDSLGWYNCKEMDPKKAPAPKK